MHAKEEKKKKRKQRWDYIQLESNFLIPTQQGFFTMPSIRQIEREFIHSVYM